MKNYFDTCTVIDAINNSSKYYAKVTKSLKQVVGDNEFSEYMEHELKSVLRHSKFVGSKDLLLSKFNALRKHLKASWIKNDYRISKLHDHCKRIQKRVRKLCKPEKSPKFQDMVHIGICGLENILNIISDDGHIYGRNKQGRPFVDIVKDEISQMSSISNPQHVYTTRDGQLSRKI